LIHRKEKKRHPSILLSIDSLIDLRTMAALIASQRAHLSKLLEKLAFSALRPVSAAPSITRSFNTSVQLRDYDDDHEVGRRSRHDDEDAALTRHSGGDAASFPSFFSGSRYLIPSHKKYKSMTVEETIYILYSILFYIHI
jgi:hypothetical protein